MPARLIEGNSTTQATAANELAPKHADHRPLYRQAQIYARQDIRRGPSTLADWIRKVAFPPKPVHA
jgi:transposase